MCRIQTKNRKKKPNKRNCTQLQYVGCVQTKCANNNNSNNSNMLFVIINISRIDSVKWANKCWTIYFAEHSVTERKSIRFLFGIFHKFATEKCSKDTVRKSSNYNDSFVSSLNNIFVCSLCMSPASNLILGKVLVKEIQPVHYNGSDLLLSCWH